MPDTGDRQAEQVKEKIEFSKKPKTRFLSDVTETAAEKYKEKKAARDLKETVQKVREFWQDINLPIRKLQEEVKKRGGKITNLSNPYRDINLSFGRMEELYRQFTEEKMKPILESISDIVKKSGVSPEIILPYVISKHGIERNRVMRSEELKRWIESQDEQPTQAEIDDKIDELSKKDYSGIRGFSDDVYENPDDLARAIINDIESNISPELINNLWEKINNATGQILDHWLKGGQISQEMYNTYKKQYKNFVPLRGWRHGAAKELRYQKGQGFGRSLRHAEGRKSLADNPLAYIQAVGFKSIGERVDNGVKNSLLNFVFNNYTDENKDLFRVKSIYYVKGEAFNPETGDVEEVWEPTLIKPSKDLFASGDARSEYYSGHMKLRSGFEGFQHEVIVHRTDGDVAIVFDGKMLDVAQAFNRQNTMYKLFGDIHDANDLRGFANVVGGFGLTNFIKQMLTSSNPVFPFTNFFRDVPEAAISMWVQDANPNVAKNIPVAMNTVRKAIWGKNVDKSDPLQIKLKRFYELGGATGFTHEKTPEQIEKELNKELKRILSGDKYKMAHGAFEAIKNWNRLFEDTTRFAVYLSSLEAGKSEEDSAMDAKEASVNFNRKGKGTKLFDSVWAFFNPAIQAAQKNFKLAKDQPKRFAAVAGSVVMLGVIEAMLNDLGDGDDDEYYNLNDYVRQNYAVIHQFWSSDKDRYLRIPLPQFWRGFHSLGVIAYDLMKGKTTTGKAVANTFLNFLGGLSPVDIPGFWVDGEFSLSPIVPTSVKPLTEAFITNRDFMGSTIAKEPFTKALEDQLAESSLNKKNVNPAIKAITDFLAKDVGGKYGDLKVDVRDGKIKYLNYFLDWNPSKIEHLVKSYFGGSGKVASDMVTTIVQLLSSEQELDIDNVPFLNSFIRNTPDSKWKVIDEYYNLKEMAGNATAVKNYAKRNMDIEKYRDVSMSDFNAIGQVMKIYDDMISGIIEAYGMDSEEGSQKVTDLMQQAVDFANKQLNIEQP